MLGAKYLDTVGKVTLDLLLASVLNAIADIDINIFGHDIHPFDGLRGWAEDLTNQAVSAYNKAVTAQQVATVAQTGANTAQSAAAAAAAAAANAQDTATTAGSTATVAQAAAAAANAAAGQAQTGVQQITDGIATGAGSSTTTGNSPSTVATNVGTIATTASNAQTTATNVGTAVQTGATGSTTSTGNTFIDGISSAVNGVFNTATVASATAIQAQLGVQQIQTANNGTNSGGQSRQLRFSGADGTALSSTDWTTSNICIRGSNGFAGIAASAAANATYLSELAYLFNTDNESVSMLVGDSGSQYAATTLLLRCNSTATVGAYCQVYNNQINIGYFTSQWNFSAGLFTSQSMNIPAGTLVEFRAAGNNYYVLVNGVQQMSFTDTGAHVTQAAANRYSGYTMFRSPPAPVSGTIYDSFRLASFAMSDIALPGVSVTPSWRVSRTSTSSVSLSVAINAGAKFPAGFFSTQDYANQATVTTLGTGVVTVAKSGFYWLTSTIQTSSGFSNYTYWCVYVNGALYTQGIPTGVSIPIYLNAGDTVQPGVFSEGRTINSQGPNSGSPFGQDATVSTINGAPGQFFSGLYISA